MSRATARFQEWEALLHNRTKRRRIGAFLIHGVRPITLAVDRGWPLRAILHRSDRPLSAWARGILAEVEAEVVTLSPDLLARLGDKDAETPELVAVAQRPQDDPGRIEVGTDFLGAAFDRPSSPGNIGALVRSLDAFGGNGLIVAGHAADPYDPKSIRASTGSLFAVPTVGVSGSREALAWARAQRPDGRPLAVVGTDELGDVDIAELDLTGPTLVVVGNETTGMSAGWRAACDVVARIPMRGTASSLNAASATTVVLYEAARQRAQRGRAA